jgi:hypothetical protein
MALSMPRSRSFVAWASVRECRIPDRVRIRSSFAKGERIGTWGTGPFDDDGASDWVWELQEARDWSVVEVALRGAADVGADDYLEAPDGQVAWAAAAVVAATDDPSISVPDEVKEWLDQNRETRPSVVRPLALQAVRRVLGPKSELVELWQEAGEDEWRANIERVAAALG